MSTGHRQHQKLNRAKRKLSLRQERGTLIQMLRERSPYALAMLNLDRRGIFGRLKWALFKR